MGYAEEAPGGEAFGQGELHLHMSGAVADKLWHEECCLLQVLAQLYFVLTRLFIASFSDDVQTCYTSLQGLYGLFCTCIYTCQAVARHSLLGGYCGYNHFIQHHGLFIPRHAIIQDCGTPQPHGATIVIIGKYGVVEMVELPLGHIQVLHSFLAIQI